MLLGFVLMLATFGEPVYAANFIGSNGAAVGAPQASRQFTYDAVDDVKKRKAIPLDQRHEDRVLDATRRAKINSYARDSMRNIATLAWTVRRHLDWVTSFTYHARTKDAGFNRELEEFWKVYSRAYNCDAAGRHSFSDLIRLLEAHAILEGDNGLLKLGNYTLQGISGERVRTPSGTKDTDEWRHGIQVDQRGYARAYAIHNRKIGGGFDFERMIPSRQMLWHGYYDWWDQCRGVSPIVASLNQFRDVYENFNFALVKAKVSQLFAIAFFRKAIDAPGIIEEDTTETNGPKYDIDFGRGPLSLDLDPGDDFKVIESATPSNQLQAFTQLVTMVALKALDIPYSMYDEAYTNFYGQRAARLEYATACDAKQQRLATLQDRICGWRLAGAILDGELVLPRTMSPDELRWEFVPSGQPWWDPTKEVNAAVQGVAGAFTTPQAVVKETSGGNVFKNIDDIAEVQEYARAKGVNLSYVPVQNVVQVVDPNQPQG